MTMHSGLMRQAVEVARRGIEAGESPFGAVIATGQGEVVVEAYNTVHSSRDSTAHAEVNAIRAACRKLNTIDLAGNIIVATCEPCPMCAAAVHWARLDAVVYGTGIEDAREAGFSELLVSCESLYQQGGRSVRVIPGILRDECREIFDLWRRGPNPIPY